MRSSRCIPKDTSKPPPSRSWIWPKGNMDGSPSLPWTRHSNFSKASFKLAPLCNVPKLAETTQINRLCRLFRPLSKDSDHLIERIIDLKKRKVLEISPTAKHLLWGFFIVSEPKRKSTWYNLMFADTDSDEFLF